MKIYFSPDYKSDTFINLKDTSSILYDCLVTGVEGLVSTIELYLGIHNDNPTPIERQAEWLKCMRSVMHSGNNSLSDSWSKNALGVSNECLIWRDRLRMAKWNNNMQQPADRFRIIAEADRIFNIPAIADRILELISAMDTNPLEPGSSIYVGVDSPQALEPLVADLLDKLAEYGTDIVYESDHIEAPADSNLAKVQRLLCSGQADDDLRTDDSSFRIWEFDTANDACRYIASIPNDDFDLYVLSDGKLLDNTQLMLGQPTSGTIIENSSPQIAQMFLLGMNLFEYPLNIHNLLAWLQSPLHPIKSELRHALVKVIVETTGYDNDAYHETIDKYLTSLSDDKEREKVQHALDTFDIRPSKMVNVSELRTFNNALNSWALQMSAISDIDESKRQQLLAVSLLCNTLSTLLEDLTETEIPYRRLEAAISTLYNGVKFRVYEAQAGARFTAECSKIVSPTDRIIWTDCYNYSPDSSPFDFLNSDERRHFTAQGCRFQSDNDYNRAAIRSLKMPVLRARRKCVIVTAKRCVGADTTKHPIMIQLNEGFKHSLINVIDKPSLSKYETLTVEYVDNVSDEAQISVGHALPMPDHESYSSLHQLIQFPLDYVLEKIACIYTLASTDLKQVSTIKGDVAHKVIETLFVGSPEEIAAKINDEFDSTVDIVIQQQGALLLLPEHEIECKQYKSELRENLEVLAEIIKANRLTVVGREHEIYTNIGLLDGEDDPGLKGFVDMVLTDSNGAIYVFDFKWTSSRRFYRDLLEQNLSLQLALYKVMLERDSAQSVAACAYFTMPRHELYTASDVLTGPNVIRVTPENNDDIVRKAINSYRYRRANIQNGLVDNEEGFALDDLDYSKHAEPDDLFPLEKMYGNESLHSLNNFSNYNSFKFGILQ